jgi:hypothetical protein
MNPDTIVGCILCFVGGFLLGRPRRCIVAIVPHREGEPKIGADIQVGINGCGHSFSNHLDATIVVETQ